jgi:YidC/Oxa1 family membrane protein insertase
VKRLELKKFTDKLEHEIDLASADLSPVGPLAIVNLGRFGDLSKAVFNGRIEEKKIIFEYTTEDGLTIEKIYYFSENEYEVRVKFLFKNASDNELDIGGYTVQYGSLDHVDPKAGIGELGIASYTNAKTVKREKVGKIKEPQTIKGPFVWTGIQNQYYTIIVKPATKIDEVLVNPIKDEKDKPKGFASAIRLGAFKLPAGAVHEEEFLFFMGPKQYNILKKFPYHFSDIIDFGFFSWISIAILLSLNFFYKIFHNYGIAIIIVTVVVKILMYPFTAKSLKSMKQMQAIQPLINEVRAKNKDNPKKMQKEMMMIYKEYKVNPMSGCLPMVAQLPIFIALFNTLRNAIELKGAKFLWVKDLSLPDTIFAISGIPVNVLPLIMGVTMVWQQKLTPTTDPQQAKMMMIMPVIFTFMFYSFPSGLVLYWLVNNILSIAQQYQVQYKK